MVRGMRAVVSTLQGDHLVRAHLTLFREELGRIWSKLEEASRKLSGTLYNAHPKHGLPHDVVTMLGKIETDAGHQEVLTVLEGLFNIVGRIDMEDEDGNKTTVLLACEGGAYIIFWVPHGFYKVHYSILLPLVLEPGIRAVKGDTEIVYKALNPLSVKSVMKVGNTLTVPLKRELQALGNPKKVEVYLDVEEGQVIIRPKE